MDKLSILLKCILLLHRENELGDVSASSSKDLVRTILSQIRNNYKPVMGGEDNIKELINMVQEMLSSPDAYDALNILQSLELILRDKPQVYANIEKNINMEIEKPGLKRSILSLRVNLNNYYKETEINAIISKAAYNLKIGKLDEGIQEFTSKLITNLEALNNVTKSKDAAIVDEVDISEHEGMEHILNKVKKQTNGDGRLRTGWQELNAMLGGYLNISYPY